MKLWVDDIRPAPEGYGKHIVCKSVDAAKQIIQYCEKMESFYKLILENDECPNFVREKTEKDLAEITLELIDLDHDAGDFASDGGDYIRILDWLEETGRNYPIRIHSQNPVGVANMRAIIEKNGWTEIK